MLGFACLFHALPTHRIYAESASLASTFPLCSITQLVNQLDMYCTISGNYSISVAQAICEDEYPAEAVPEAVRQAVALGSET
jgi:hypothetical protein